jgi:cobyrinic acid a,c-diamide synthase
MHNNSPRLLIAGVSSGVGKTTFSVGLCRALMRRGLRVAMFKCGPDYLDPTYLQRASRSVVHNLDSWLMPQSALRETFVRNAAQADISLVEGVMGLFDGASATELTGSSAEIARLLDSPIALVCDASGMARSVAALCKGFATFEPGIAPSAVICNRVGSPAHLELLRRAQLAAAGAPILGGLPKRDAQRFPERHLGLVSARELASEELFEAWADQVDAHCDVDALLALARSAAPLSAARAVAQASAARCRIGVARDAAFHFYYDANLRLLEAAGAELVEFSPLRDAELPQLDGLYIGGGYPELHAAQLSANHSMLECIRAHAQRHKPIYAECGGLMYLSEAIVERSGARHAQLGLIHGVAAMCDRLQALGYVEIVTREATLLGPAGTRYRGHQFRYSRFETERAPQRLDMHSPRTGQRHLEGYGADNVLATYVHGHWASNPAIPEAFVAACSAHVLNP